MKRLLALGFLGVCALGARDANATAAVLFSAGGNAHVDRHNITVTLGATGTVTWDSIDVSGSPDDIGIVVAVKAGGKVEITDPAFTSATDLATKVVVKTLPSGITCNSVGGGVDFTDGGVSASSSSGSSGNGSGSGEGSSGCGGSGGGGGGSSGGGSSEGSGGCGSCDDKNNNTSNKEATGGCLTSSQGGCGSCDDNGGDGCNCEPSDHGHPGCSAIHGCSSQGFGDDDDITNPRRDSGGSSGSSGSTGSSIGPYEEVRIKSGDGSAQKWLDNHGYVAPGGFIDGIVALEADGYEIHAFRARAPASPAIVKSLRVVTTSPSPTVPLRLVRMSSGTDASATPVTLITLAGSKQDLVGQTMVSIDENKLAYISGSSNYEVLVSAALGSAPPPSDAGASDAGTADGGTSDAGALSTDTRWIAETSRAVTASTTGDGGSSGSLQTLGDFFRDACGARTSQSHVVCEEESDGGSAEPADAGDDAGEDAGDAGAPASDAGTDGGTSDGGADTGLPAGCKDVARERCDDLSLALPAGVNVASRFRGVVGGTASAVGDLSFSASTAPLHSGVFTVRPTGEPGLCAPVNDDGTIGGSSSGSSSGDISGSGSGSGSASCKATRRSRFRIDLGPLVTVLVVIRVLSAVMRRKRKK